jgi:hypothetical protein
LIVGTLAERFLMLKEQLLRGAEDPKAGRRWARIATGCAVSVEPDASSIPADLRS